MTVKDKMTNWLKRFDGMLDSSTTRGSTTDKTMRLVGQTITRNKADIDALIAANGFFKRIIEKPAIDATREWIDITTSDDTEENNIGRAIITRMEELDVQKKIKQLIVNSRRYQTGGYLYYGVIAGNIVDADLSKPLPNIINKIDFINSIENSENVTIQIDNRYDPTKRDYMQPKYYINGILVDPSRFSVIVNDFNSDNMRGSSVIDVIYDAVSAQDSALWSVSSMMQNMAIMIYKSDNFANLPIDAKTEFLTKFKHYTNSQSVAAIDATESMEKLTWSVTGIGEVFSFIFDNLAGVSGIPKKILLGLASGVVTGAEYDTMNYYADIAKLQELQIKPILEKIVNMIIREKRGPVGQMVKNPDALDWEIVFNPIWSMDPLSEIDIEIRKAQRDEIDVNIGKVSPEEVRQLDERYSGLERDTTMEALTRIINEPVEEEEVSEEEEKSGDESINE